MCFWLLWACVVNERSSPGTAQRDRRRAPGLLRRTAGRMGAPSRHPALPRLVSTARHHRSLERQNLFSGSILRPTDMGVLATTPMFGRQCRSTVSSPSVMWRQRRDERAVESFRRAKT